MNDQVPLDEAMDRAVEVRTACRASRVPDPVITFSGRDGFLLTWEPVGVKVELLVSLDGTVRWTDPARPAGIVFDVFSPDPFVARVAEWYAGGPIIGEQRITMDELNEIRSEPS